jgi:glutamate synthase (NADPH/NADH) large chain
MKQKSKVCETPDLYREEYEHDACGVGLLADLGGGKSHQMVEDALRVLEQMLHRGAESADNKTGDGAGILTQVPHEFILLQGIPVPEKGKYGTGLVFFPREEAAAASCRNAFEEGLSEEGLRLLAERQVPVNSDILGEISRSREPDIRQVFITGEGLQGEALERKLYRLRRRVEKKTEAVADFYIVSLSTRRLIYKGMLTSTELRNYFPDLTNPYYTSGLALVHSRFSTNTFPTWSLAQPFRLLGHNGEINTIRGNRFWMEARENVLRSPLLGDAEALFPVVQPRMSDSASLDNVLEYLLMAGMSFPHALAMLVPESWNEKNPLSPQLKAFYEYHSILMEPWDGPATLLFSDGRYAGGMLDRNGLRPARYLLTTDNRLCIASEAGVLPFEPAQIKAKGRLQPGKILLVDTDNGRIYQDKELKEELASAYPYRDWLAKNRVILSDIHSGRSVRHDLGDSLMPLLQTFGYSREDIHDILIPMTTGGKEPTGSMGNDIPLAVLSKKPQRLFNYFRQLFAQVTNPPIDPIREELVMSLKLYIGCQEANMFEPKPEQCKMVRLENPILTNEDLDILTHLDYKGFRTITLRMLFPAAEGTKGLEAAIDALCRRAEEAVDKGYNYIVLSDRGVTSELAPIPALLALSAIHHYLIERRKRMQTAIVVETAAASETMHFALLFGFGASAVNPYMAYALLDDQVRRHEVQLDYATAEKNYRKAVSKGLLKVLSKMGISTLGSYRGAQIFEAVGLSRKLLDRYFPGMNSSVGGADLDDLCMEQLQLHRQGFAEVQPARLENRGMYAYRRGGEPHAWNPETIARLQIATRRGDYALFKEFSALADNKPEPIFLRDFLSYKKGKAVDLAEVEPVESITRRFVTGAMSFGAISKEVHEILAIAMNLLHGKSNTGEGGEEASRFHPSADGLPRRSAIKQIASGRFGVTTEYLVNADELQIKVAQGAKPGEGGQLPGFKVDKLIAATRHSIPGITLISPPPHHDIYSIEDLAQLIFDLKNVNPSATVSVKLVAESGVGTIAAGVAKAKADTIVISGAEGGTGASPLSSIKYAGIPGEIGLAETQQTLVMNDLRGFVRLQTDGQLKTGRDIIVSALLGAEEYGFATAALVVLGCVMMRKCHTNNCPVGVATQDEALRRRFTGRYEYLLNFFRFLAEEVREHLAEMGFRSLDEIIGRADLLEVRELPGLSEKAKKIDFSKLLAYPRTDNARKCVRLQEHKIADVLDRDLIRKSSSALERQLPVEVNINLSNTDRTLGAMLSGEVAKRYGSQGLPENTIRIRAKGSAGQSFGAFLATGITLRLEGEANDYLGKGLSGGRIILVPPAGSSFAPEENIIAGNTLLYGATSGEVFINGRVGERCCVRNSGATAVVEGVGDHCCEYMTGGLVVVLGSTGKNFAAGMSGGIAYVLNTDETFDYFCNMDMVELSLVDDPADRMELHRLVSAHARHTQSPLAERLLKDWDNALRRFIKVTPFEYKKILEERKMAAIDRKIAQIEHDY